ncbi:MAG: PP2C family protein-serine/threonine phosphatase [Bacteroidales bacterium]|nr:PP2C family protein-serine/threonine phosphatase [Bacteroidales bacterium]
MVKNGKTALVADRLKLYSFKLRALLDVTKNINANLPIPEFLESYKRLLTQELSIGKVLLFIKEKDDWEIKIKTSVELEDYENIDIERDLLPLTEITFSMSNPVFKGFDFIIPVIQDGTPLAYVLIGDFDGEQKGIAPSIRNLLFIQTLSIIIIVAIENRRMQELILQQERFKKEMEMASEIQNFLVPHEDIFKHETRLALKAFYMPHYEVGGDYYDFDYLSDDEIFFCIADVTGKGMSAAILMSNFQASLKALITSQSDLTLLVKRLNRIVVKNTNGERFITLFLGRYNFKTNELRYINAGHNAPILYNRVTGEKQFLELGCQGMGMLDEIFPREGVITLTHDSKLLCFTDGVVELDKDGIDYYGQQVVEQRVGNDSGISETINGILSDLDINRSNTKLFDDITLLGIDFYVDKK